MADYTNSRKTAVITGASGEIGGCIAERLYRDGYNTALIYNKNQTAANNLKRDLSGGGKAECYRCDLSDEASVNAAARQIIGDFSGVDLIVNCAGISKTGLITDFNGADFDEIFSVNVKSAFMLTNAFLPQMINKKSGCIINISSMWGETGASCEVLYSATKAALIGYTKALARELAPSGIRVNCVLPGFIDTKMNNHLLNEEKQAFACDVPLGVLGSPFDIAAAVSFLASDEARYITGQTLGVNGGYVM